MVEMFVVEGVWDFEWCIVVMEVEGGNLSKVWGWLVDWVLIKVYK